MLLCRFGGMKRLIREIENTILTGFLLDEDLTSTLAAESHHQPSSRCQHQQQQPSICKYLQPNSTTAQLRPRSELSLDDRRVINCCSECATAPPPYGRSPTVKDVRAIELDEEVVHLLAANKNIPSTLNDERRKCFRSCQDLQRPSRRYLLLALEHDNNSDAELCSSYPSVAPVGRRHTGSRERLCSLRSSQRRKDKPIIKKPSGRDLQEVVVHRLLENGKRASAPSTPKVDQRRADVRECERLLPELGSSVGCCNGSEGSCETNSSSENEAANRVEAVKAGIQPQPMQPAYTSV